MLKQSLLGETTATAKNPCVEHRQRLFLRDGKAVDDAALRLQTLGGIDDGGEGFRVRVGRS